MAIIIASNMKLLVDGQEMGVVQSATIEGATPERAEPVSHPTSVSAQISFTAAPDAKAIIGDMIVTSRLGQNWKN